MSFLRIRGSCIRFLDEILTIIDPILPTDPIYSTRIQQFIDKFSFKSFIGLSSLLSIIHILFFFISDINSKDPIEPFLLYRFGISILIFSILILGGYFKKQVNLLIILELLVFTIGMAYQSHLGYPLRIKWVIWIPFLVLAFHFRSLFLNILLLNLLTFLATQIWATKIELAYMRGDLIFCNAGLILSHFIWRLIINSRLQEFKNIDLIQQSLKEKMELYDELKSFVPPVLVEQLEKKLRSSGSMHVALDEIMRRRKNKIAILYTDFRDYSTRSTNLNFVENELIPTSTKLLDQCEENKGIGRLIGDNVMVFYHLEDNEESLIRALRDCAIGAVDEDVRIQAAERSQYERYFILTFGDALIGNMGSNYHRDVTIVGDPINLAARIDDLTKSPELRRLLDAAPHVIIDPIAFQTLQQLATFEVLHFNLESNKLSLRSYEEVKQVILLPLNERNLSTMNELCNINSITFLQKEYHHGKILNIQ